MREGERHNAPGSTPTGISAGHEIGHQLPHFLHPSVKVRSHESASMFAHRAWAESFPKTA
jgi:hypothetical protein